MDHNACNSESIGSRSHNMPAIRRWNGIHAIIPQELREKLRALGTKPVLSMPDPGLSAMPHTGLPHLALPSEFRQASGHLVPRQGFVANLAGRMIVEWLSVARLVQELPAWAVDGLERGQFAIADEGDMSAVQNICLLAWRSDGVRVIRYAPDRITSENRYGQECLRQLERILTDPHLWSALHLEAGELAVIDNHQAIRRYRLENGSARFAVAYAIDENNNPPHHTLPWLSGSPLLSL